MLTHESRHVALRLGALLTSAAVLGQACRPSLPESGPPEEALEITPADTTVPGRALLIGVGEFASDEVTPLLGPANDVALMRSLLCDRYGFVPERVQTLLNEEATFDAVREALDEHVAAVADDEIFVLYFSGHGSQSPDRGDDETEDGKDETLILYDSRTPGSWDLSDDNLRHALGALTHTHAVVILDACHSGSGTRGVLAVRAVEPDERDADTRGRGRRNDASARGLVSSTRIADNHVLLGAAASDQFAYEVDIAGRRHGVFTYALVRALSRTDLTQPDMRLHDFAHGPLQYEVARLRDILNLKGLANPQLDAPLDVWDRPLFQLERSTARLDWAPAVPEGEGRVRVLGGATAGGAAGSVWAVWPAGELEFSLDSALGSGICIELRGNDAVLELDATARDDYRAALVAVSPAEPVPIHLAGEDVRAELAAPLASALGRAGELTDELVPGGWTIARDSAETWSIRHADESSFATVDSDEVGQAVRDVVDLARQRAMVRAFQALEHPAGELGLIARLAQTESLRGKTDRGTSFSPDLDLPTYRLSQSIGAGNERSLKNHLLVDVWVARPCYLALIHVAPGGIATVFPNDLSEGADFLPGGRIDDRGWVRIPDAVPDEKNRNVAQFSFPIEPPPGIESLIAFAVSDEGTARSVRQRLARHAGDPDAVLTELAELREELVAGRFNTDDGTPVDWSVASMTWIVRE